jgi:tetratricopeptide (TPR) repeat protein
VFRDEEELAASSDLSKEIDAALVASKFLIIVCTPRTPHSKWVNEEIRRFRELGRSDRILALLVEGEPRESFPPALLEIRNNEGGAPGAKSGFNPIEPLAADVREEARVLAGHSGGHTRSMAKLRMIAALAELSFDDLRNREQRRTQGRIVATLAASLVVAVAFAIVALYALAQRAEAIHQRQLADQQRDQAIHQRQLAQDRLAQVKYTLDIVQQVEDVAEQTDLSTLNRFDMTPISVVMMAQRLKDVDTVFPDEPLFGARLRMRLANAYEHLREYGTAAKYFDLAQKVFREHLGEDRFLTVQAIRGLGRSLAMGDPLEALGVPEKPMSDSAIARFLAEHGRKAEGEVLRKWEESKKSAAGPG